MTFYQHKLSSPTFVGFFVYRHLGLLGCNIPIMKRFLPLLILTGLLFGQGWTHHSGVERNDIFQEYNEQPHEGDPTVFIDSNFRHLNTIRTQRDDEFLLSMINQTWDGTQWVDLYQYTYTYDTNDNTTSQLTQTWDGTQWVNLHQATFTYDANDNMTSQLMQSWETGWANWVNVFLNTYTYDANNNRTSQLLQSWDGTQWVNLGQGTTIFDANNNMASSLSQTWSDTGWVNTNQYTYTYNANNNITGYLSQTWDGTQWVDWLLSTTTYDTTNNLKIELSQTWEGTQWVNLIQNTVTYDDSNNVTFSFYQTWIDTGWVNSHQYIYNYDANNNRTSQLRQTWDGTQWVNDYQFTYTWGQLLPFISGIPPQEMVEDQTLVLILTAQSSFSGDTFVFFASSDTSAVGVDVTVDTLHIVPANNWTGMALITVIVNGENGSDTTGFTLTVTPVNDLPEEFSVIYPTVSDTFSTHVDNDTLIQFTWGKSNDIDSEITYNLTIKLEFFGNTYTDIHENISDTTIGISSNSLDPLMNITSQEQAVFTYYVHASDEEYTIESDTGSFVLSGSALWVDEELSVPKFYAIHQNYPNPFNPVTTLRYELPEQTHVNITIYDMLGRQVKTLINHTQDAGYRSVIWNATNDYGKPVSAGIYLYQIQAGEYMQTKKMVLLK